MIGQKIRSLAALAAIGFAAPSEASAYIDPGAGSLLLQGLVGGVAACLALGGAYWRKIKAFVSRGGRSRSSME